MATLDLYSNRRKRELSQEPDVFIYDEVPQKLRNQVSYIVEDAVGSWYRGSGYENLSRGVYAAIVDEILRHTGRVRIGMGGHELEQLTEFIRIDQNVLDWLDGVEICFRTIGGLNAYRQRVECEAKIPPDEAVQDLNTRFMQNGVGYQFESGRLIRIDSKYLHAEVVKPTLALLQDPRFKGANEEFLKAHEHYRNGEVKDCLTNALKAFESTLKTICTIRKWAFDPKDTAKPLLDICFKNALVPDFWQSHFSGLRSTLEAGMPVMRNKLGGHGQGITVIDVPPHYAAYALHLTGSAIQFLIEAEKSLP